MKQEPLWGKRLQMNESFELTLTSLAAYGARDHWAIAWSGGKDSTALVTFVVWAILSGKAPRPKTLTILYADTRLEILPLWLAAASIRAELDDAAPALAAVGVELRVRTVIAPMDQRFFVYMLGRGVPPPNNRFRWCTQKMKIDPMIAALQDLAVELGLGDARSGSYVGRALGDIDCSACATTGLIERRRCKACGGAGKTPTFDKLLVLTGVRVGESAARDQRIALSCSRDGAECGQGWYQEATPDALADKLAPILAWRVCHVWEWLRHWAPKPEFGDWSTEIIADAYGGDEAEENNARTGCVGCNLVEEDRALATVCRMPAWSYLAPLRWLKDLWGELLVPAQRLRKPGGELTKAGTLAAKQQRLGPLTIEARRFGLTRVLAIQAEVNAAAEKAGRPAIDILNPAEIERIKELQAAGTWPEGWEGTEPTGDVVLEKHFEDGSVQQLLLRPEDLAG